MSKRDDLNTEDFNDDLALSDEFSSEPTIENGPTPVTVPLLGKLDQLLHQYSHCGFCAGRLHFNYASDFSRNTTHEKVTCPECSLEARQVMHRLQ